MKRATRRAACVLAGLLALGGCSPDDAPAAGPEPGSDPSATPLSDPTCQDADDDSTDPGLDLLSVRLVRTGDRVQVIVSESAFPPQENAVVWVVGFISADGERSVELVTKLVDGTETSHSVLAGGRTQTLDDPVRITPTAMTTTFPVEKVDDLGPGTRWYATLSSNGAEIDYCPGGAELTDTLDIRPQPLPDRW